MAGLIALGARFSTFNELKSAIAQYGEQNYVDININTSKRLIISQANRTPLSKFAKASPDLVYSYLDYRCIHGGKYKMKSGGVRRTTTFKRDCPFHISVKVSSDGQSLEIRSFIEEHNHELSKEIYMCLPKQRRLPRDLQKNVADMLHMKANKKMVYEKIRKDTGKLITYRDLTNIARNKSLFVDKPQEDETVASVRNLESSQKANHNVIQNDVEYHDQTSSEVSEVPAASNEVVVEESSSSSRPNLTQTTKSVPAIFLMTQNQNNFKMSEFEVILKQSLNEQTEKLMNFQREQAEEDRKQRQHFYDQMLNQTKEMFEYLKSKQ